MYVDLQCIDSRAVRMVPVPAGVHEASTCAVLHYVENYSDPVLVGNSSTELWSGQEKLLL